MIRFENDDAGYATWLKSHPTGFVLNYGRPTPEPDYLKLHRATCGAIRPTRGKNWTHLYGKACSAIRRELEDLAVHWGGEAQPDPLCLDDERPPGDPAQYRVIDIATPSSVTAVSGSRIEKVVRPPASLSP